jgi:chemosensory pili system protein ChpA (sensor histidine kinase/response regulator)
MHVDEMIGNQEVVVKNIGPQLARVSGISGATVLGTGEIVLIINPVQLAQRADVPTFDRTPSSASRRRRTRRARDTAAGHDRRRLAHGAQDHEPRCSRARIRRPHGEGRRGRAAGAGEHTPDVILLDIEMPRMDGFEFTKTIKGDPKNAHIPIIMITSRTAEKHRNRAAELGVDLYLGKPYQEDELLKHLREMLSIAAPA